jgi:hypothetical protein
MIAVEEPDEPATFHLQCRQPGNAWLAANADGDPPSRFWRPFLMDLCRGFKNRCGYSAMWDLNGTVDHYLSRENRRDLAFEWTNFRYIAGWLNSSKQTLDQDVLDPFQVNNDWFEIVLPTLVMQLTPCVPKRIRPVAEFTLTRLHLADGDRVYEQRKIYYFDEFIAKNRSVAWLEDYAPILATAVRRERVLAHLVANPTVSIDEVAQLCETARDDAYDLVRQWVDAGHLQSQGRGRGVRYVKA